MVRGALGNYMSCEVRASRPFGLAQGPRPIYFDFEHYPGQRRSDAPFQILAPVAFFSEADFKLVTSWGGQEVHRGSEQGT